VHKYIEQRIKLHKQYQIKEKIQDINNALNNLRDGNYGAVHWIQKLIQKLDQRNTTICLEAENMVPSPRITYSSRNMKQILSKMYQLRLEIRIYKRYNNLDNLKLLIKKTKNLNQKLIYATKNQWKDLNTQEVDEIEKIKTLNLMAKMQGKLC
jgi:hypothetical protein